MNLTQKKTPLAKLRQFVKYLVSCGIKTSEEYRAWTKEEAQSKLLADYFDSDSKAPLCSLVNVFFHPEVDLLGLNYTPLAHNTLYKSQNGWTDPMRLCRGIIFDSKANLVFLGYEKFFNYGEHQETKDLPDCDFEAYVKEDGHLGGIFQYGGSLHITTRGSFVSPTVEFAEQMLVDYAQKNNWRAKLSKDICPVVEIIHPKTKVIVDYHGEEKFILTGAFNRRTLEDFSREKLQALAAELGLPLIECWQGKSLAELKAFMQDRSVRNREGFVVRFANGLRVKFKFVTYLREMIRAKLSVSYILNQAMNGSLAGKMDALDGELTSFALNILSRVMVIMAQPISVKEKRQKLYELLSPEGDTPYDRQVCRNFVKAINASVA